MIDERILDKILPIKDKDEYKEEIKAELIKENFKITNFNTGGIFYHLMMILIQCKIDLTKLLRKVINNVFVSHGENDWLELKGADFSKIRKEATKTKGNVTIIRDDVSEALTINKGHVFKTKQNADGTELKYFVIENTIIPINVAEFEIAVEAESTGSKYNVPNDQITKTLVHLENVVKITNNEDWLISEGSDQEDIENFRKRILNSWAELSNNPIRDKYKNVAESIQGVLYARVDDMHPRGQGTIDIIVTGTAGKATDTLLENVLTAIESIKGNYDNILVKSSETVTQDFEIIVYISENISDENVIETAENNIKDIMRLSTGRELNVLYREDIIYSLRKDIKGYKKSDIIQPSTDVIFDIDKVIIIGNINITVERL